MQRFRYSTDFDLRLIPNPNVMLASKEFTWISPLGLSVACFLLSGLLYVLIGVLTPIVHKALAGKSYIIMSPRTDSQFFGESTQTLLSRDKNLDDFRGVMYMLLAGLLVFAGLMESGVAWFALRHGEKWAIIALTVAGLAQIPLWLLSYNYYWQRGIHLGLGDMQPFVWIPTLLLIPGVIAGWVGVLRLQG